MLLGQHEHSLDDKNRLTLPAKLRERLGGDVVITLGMDGCLFVYARGDWDALATRIGGLDSLSAASRQMQRHFFANNSKLNRTVGARLVIENARRHQLAPGGYFVRQTNL